MKIGQHLKKWLGLTDEPPAPRTLTITEFWDDCTRTFMETMRDGKLITLQSVSADCTTLSRGRMVRAVITKAEHEPRLIVNWIMEDVGL